VSFDLFYTCVEYSFFILRRIDTVMIRTVYWSAFKVFVILVRF